MSNYIKLETGEVKTQGEWRQANKHISLPRVWTATTLTDLGLTAVLAAPKPACTDLEQVIGNGVTTDANGNTVEAWSVVDKFADTTDEDGVVTTKAEHEADYTAKKDADAAAAGAGLCSPGLAHGRRVAPSAGHSQPLVRRRGAACPGLAASRVSRP